MLKKYTISKIIIKKEVIQFRKQISVKLINLEKRILDELNQKVEQKTTNLKSEIKKLEQTLEKVKKDIQETNATKKYASNFKTWLGCKAMETEVARDTNLLQSMEKMTEIVSGLQLNFNGTIKYWYFAGHFKVWVDLYITREL